MLILSAAEHGLDALAQTGPLGERDEQRDGLGRDAVLGVVEVEVAGLERHRLAPVGVARRTGRAGGRRPSRRGAARAPSTPSSA